MILKSYKRQKIFSYIKFRCPNKQDRSIGGETTSLLDSGYKHKCQGIGKVF